jgi:hypothetical protein
MHSFSRGHHLPMLCRRCAVGSPNKLGQSCRKDEVGIFWNTDSRHIQWGSRVGEESSRCDALLWWELKTCVLKDEDLRAGEVGTNLDGHIGGIGGFWLSAENGMTYFRRGPFTQRSMSFGQKNEVGALHRLEFVMM